MRTTLCTVLFAATVMVAGCSQVDAPSGPPIAGSSMGTAQPATRALVEQQPHSANAAAGTASISGARGDGRPTIERSGSDTGNTVGGVPSEIQGAPTVQRSRSNKGGG